MTRTTKGTVATLGLWTVSLLVMPLPAPAQTVQQILQEAEAAHSERLRGVQNVTLVEDVMGIAQTTYLETEVVDGHTQLRPRFTIVSGARVDEAPGEFFPQTALFHPELADRIRLEGAGEVDGNATHVLVVEDFEGVPGWEELSAPEGEFIPQRGELHLDSSLLVLRKLTLEGDMVYDGERAATTTVVHFEDYREADGLLMPFRTRVELQLPTSLVSAEEREQMRQAFQELQRELEAAPPEQREMMERIMGPRMEEMAEMLEGETIEVAQEVREVRVNAGPPEEL